MSSNPEGDFFANLLITIGALLLLLSGLCATFEGAVLLAAISDPGAAYRGEAREAIRWFRLILPGLVVGGGLVVLGRNIRSS